MAEIEALGMDLVGQFCRIKPAAVAFLEQSFLVLRRPACLVDQNVRIFHERDGAQDRAGVAGVNQFFPSAGKDQTDGAFRVVGFECREGKCSLLVAGGLHEVDGKQMRFLPELE